MEDTMTDGIEKVGWIESAIVMCKGFVGGCPPSAGSVKPTFNLTNDVFQTFGQCAIHRDLEFLAVPV